MNLVMMHRFDVVMLLFVTVDVILMSVDTKTTDGIAIIFNLLHLLSLSPWSFVFSILLSISPSLNGTTKRYTTTRYRQADQGGVSLSYVQNASPFCQSNWVSQSDWCFKALLKERRE